MSDGLTAYDLVTRAHLYAGDGVAGGDSAFGRAMLRQPGLVSFNGVVVKKCPPATSRRPSRISEAALAMVELEEERERVQRSRS